AGARAGMLPQMAGQDAIGNLIHEIGRSDDIGYIYLANAAGEVVHHSIPSLEGKRILWRPVFGHPEDIRTRVRRLADGTRVYEMATPFTTMDMRAQETPSPLIHSSEAVRGFHNRATVYLGMRMDTYEAARRADLQHAAIMGGIVLALGVGVLYFFFVINSYVKLSRTLQSARDYTRQVVGSMVHGVLSIDMEGKVVSHNRQAVTLLGLPESKIDGFDLRDVFDFEAVGIAATLASGTPVLNHEFRLAGTSGEAVPMMLTVTPIRDDSGSPGGAVVVIRDLSPIKQLEEQVRRSEKLAAVGSLAAGVAHEIRNPLSSIRGFAYLLGRNCNEASHQKEYADVMVREIDRINLVVTDLLNFARPMILEPEQTDIRDLIDHVVSLVYHDALNRGVDVGVDCEQGLSAMQVDPNQITQALLNLMLNAVSAMDSGGTARIKARRLADGGGMRICVEDNGPGIPPDRLERIFEPFFTTRKRGTGLGLAMVRKIAENHDGEAQVASPPPGKKSGTLVTLLIKEVTAVRQSTGEIR
ncbi:MAG TPA: ATP-binding protein, partial [Desulfosarcina sp.]|nr:ATP-binding protein [Desulfosarcina sp.]